MYLLGFVFINILGHICSRGHQLDTPKSKVLYSKTKQVPYGFPKGGIASKSYPTLLEVREM